MEKSDNKIYLSVIIPVFNGEFTVGDLFLGIERFCREKDIKFEVIFVYDNGPDNSLNALKELCRGHPATIKLVKLTRNYGQHNAIIAGIESAQGDFIITMDEDLQHDPDDIHLLIKEQRKGDYDVVYGKYDEKKHGRIRNLGSTFLKKLIAVGVPEVHRDYSAYRLIKKDIAKKLLLMKNSYTFLDGYISWVTTNCSSCVVSHRERQGGKSSYSLKKLINHTINIFVTFSDIPLKFLTFSSILIFLVTSCFSLYVFIRKIIFDNYEVGYASLIIAIGFGVAVIMLSIGILGEYIYRINLKTTKKPNYIIDKSFNTNNGG